MASRAKKVFIGVLGAALLAAAGGSYYWYNTNYPSTDDA